jgi:hypothetical protein
MWKKIAISGAVGAAILGSGAAAMAASASGSLVNTALANAATATSTAAPVSTGSTSGTSGGAAPVTTAPGGKKAGDGSRARRLRLTLRNLEHAEWVTSGKSGDVTHEAAEGLVTAVTPTSITVAASDGFSETFAVSSATKVHVKGAGKTISAVAMNDRVLVAGVKAGTAITANQILDAGPKK